MSRAPQSSDFTAHAEDCPASPKFRLLVATVEQAAEEMADGRELSRAETAAISEFFELRHRVGDPVVEHLTGLVDEEWV